MLLENINIEIVTLSVAVFGLVLMMFILFVRNKENSQYELFPHHDKKLRQGQVKLQLVDMEEDEDDEDDVVTEVINTMDYHQVPKELIAEKARKLAAGNDQV